MRLDLVTNGVLLAAALGFAYWASIPADENEVQKIDVIDIAPKSVAAMKLTGPDLVVEAKRRDDGERFWIDFERTEKPKDEKKPADPHAAPDAAKEGETESVAAEPVVKKERLLGNEKLDELLASFAPLKAERMIGMIKEDQYSEFGLDGLKWKFVVTQDGGKETHYFLGKKSYGSQNRFVMETDAAGKPGRVILVSDQGFDNFEKANLRMHDRRLVKVPLEEVTKAEVKAGTVTKVLAHTQKDKAGEPVWTDDEEGAAPKPSYETWMDRINKLRLAGYATPEQEQQLAATAPFLEIALEKNGAVVDRMLFRKLPGEKPQYFVTSGFLKVHANVVASRAEPVEKDIATVFGDTKS
jgi:hypothetical protein